MALIKYKPTTPGRRGMTGYTFEELTTNKPLKRLTKRLKRNAGRNNRGIITTRHRGGGAVKKYRETDFKQMKNHGIVGTVSSIEYDPVRTAYIMLVTYKNGDKCYHLCPEGIKAGSEIITAEKAKIRTGNRMQLKNIPVGFDIYNLELKLDKGGQAVRSAGTSAKILGIDGDYAQVQLPSKEIRLILKECYASVGRISNIDHNQMNIGKAGRTRRMGRRPQVRGKVMNPNDHPHGGGEGRNSIGLKYPKTPWGRPALGVKTRRRKDSNRLVMKTRKGKLNIK
ncbi:MAG: 50S ribosomal protein L2 [Candidatus Gracilibacteria bacterium]|nr:50S ribosomal protein L2 [bacterium]MDZ4217065.1 50S ribosomal protein L2 [Candidatus Gracilibacteria bacterium]